MKTMLTIISCLLLAACGSSGSNNSLPTQLGKIMFGNFSTVADEYPVTTIMKFPAFVNISTNRLTLTNESTGQTYSFNNKSASVALDTEDTCQDMVCRKYWVLTTNHTISPTPPAGNYKSSHEMVYYQEAYGISGNPMLLRMTTELPYQVQ